MRLALVPRAQPSGWMALLTPVIAILAMMAAGAVFLAALGKDPAEGLYVYFIQPFDELWQFLMAPEGEGWYLFYTPSEVIVKAIPLALMGAGLAVCFRANVWNIGAAGQYTLGAICAGLVALAVPDAESHFWLVPYCLAGIAGGMLWAAIPAALRTRFNANEILVSLMLTYVATLLLDWLIRGPLRDPQGYGFPQSRDFSEGFVMPVLVETTRLHWGLVLAVAAALVLWVMMSRTMSGFRLRVTGASPRAAGFAGFSPAGAVWFTLLVSGGLAGLAGAVEVSANVRQLQPDIAAGYGFTAIIVAFLGRLNPLGALPGALVLAVSYIGGENAEIFLKLPKNATAVFQGMLLLFLLAADTLIRYRIALVRTA